MFNDQTFTVTGIESDTVREITGQIVAVDRTTITASSEVGELEFTVAGPSALRAGDLIKVTITNAADAQEVP